MPRTVRPTQRIPGLAQHLCAPYCRVPSSKSIDCLPCGWSHTRAISICICHQCSCARALSAFRSTCKVIADICGSACRSPESQTASTLYRLAHAALTVVCESAQPLCMVAASSSALKQMLSCLSTGISLMLLICCEVTQAGSAVPAQQALRCLCLTTYILHLTRKPSSCRAEWCGGARGVSGTQAMR